MQIHDLSPGFIDRIRRALAWVESQFLGGGVVEESDHHQANAMYVARLPAAGIPARKGRRLGKAYCEIWRSEPVAFGSSVRDLEPNLLPDGSRQKEWVYNLSSKRIRVPYARVDQDAFSSAWFIDCPCGVVIASSSSKSSSSKSSSSKSSSSKSSSSKSSSSKSSSSKSFSSKSSSKGSSSSKSSSAISSSGSGPNYCSEQWLDCFCWWRWQNMGSHRWGQYNNDGIKRDINGNACNQGTDDCTFPPGGNWQEEYCQPAADPNPICCCERPQFDGNFDAGPGSVALTVCEWYVPLP